MKKLFLFITGCMACIILPAQVWSVCNAPAFTSRVDDLFMLDAQTGYAVSGDGYIVKTANSGVTWQVINYDDSVYCRSVEFINPQKGFVGGFPAFNRPTDNIFRRTTDGGATWTDLTYQLDPRARKGICGLCVADSNTIYGCGNWYQDSAYIVKSTDGGTSWNFIDMHSYAASLIDMCFLNKDTGFVTGRGVLPTAPGIILYTTDGGQSWTYNYQSTTASEYCWKIQRLDMLHYFASIEEQFANTATILKSIDGGMSWTEHQVQNTFYNIEGVGFIDTLKGWTGGGFYNSFESNDGGLTWDSVAICPQMNRVFKVNDTLLFATGAQIWRYSPTPTGIVSPVQPHNYATLTANPNPVSTQLEIDISFTRQSHALLQLYNASGQVVRNIDNGDHATGKYHFSCNTAQLPAGIYTLILKTHEDQESQRIVVIH